MRIAAKQAFSWQTRNLKPGDVVNIDPRIGKLYLRKYPHRWGVAPPEAPLGAAVPPPPPQPQTPPTPEPRGRGRRAAAVTEGLQTGDTSGDAGQDTVSGGAVPVSEGSTEGQPAVDQAQPPAVADPAADPAANPASVTEPQPAVAAK